MKKGWIFLIAAATVVGGFWLTGSQPRDKVTVDTVVLQPRAVEQTVLCSGAVEAGESIGVFPGIPCVIAEVPVQAGQQVAAGEVLARIDKEATRQLVAEDFTALLALAAMGETITADRQGILVSVKAKEGEILAADTPCAVLAPRTALQVRVSIRERDLPRLQTGMAVRVSGDGFGKKSYAGTLTEISSAASSAGSGAVVEGVVTLAEGVADSSLRLGLTAKAAVVTQTVSAGLVIPYEAVESVGGQDYIYLLEDGCARRRTVSVTAQLADGLLVADDGLRGATVILRPEHITEDGQPVTPREAET